MAQFNVRVTDVKRYVFVVEAPDGPTAEAKAAALVDQEQKAPYATARATKSVLIDPDTF